MCNFLCLKIINVAATHLAVSVLPSVEEAKRAIVEFDFLFLSRDRAAAAAAVLSNDG